MKPEDRLRWIYESQDQHELSHRYDEWSQEYDKHLEEELNYIAPDIGVSLLTKHIAIGARILDAGAGTGLVGERLHAAGFRNLVAVDNSPGMLQQAKKKEVYTDLLRQDLLQPLDFSDASFDAVISIGVFTDGHVSADAFDELIRVTRPGGFIIFSVLQKFYEQGHFHEELLKREQAGKWYLFEPRQPFNSRKNLGADATGLAFLYKVI